MRHAALALALAACADVGAEPDTAIAGRLTVGPGVVFAEYGPVQQGEFESCALIGEDGRFELPLRAGGTWGVHLYVEDYIYLPLEVEVAEGDVTPIEQSAIAWQVFRQGETWSVSGRQPADLYLLAPPADPFMEDNPVVTSPSARTAGPGTLALSMEIADPDDDLSRQTLVCNPATREGIKLNPPAAPVEDVFPDGTYTATYYAPEGADASRWIFLAADHACSVSRILEAATK